MKKESLSDNTLAALGSLEHTHNRLITKVNVLYRSFNVQAKFPELDGISLDFVWTLLLACDLKINIHKWAIGSFFEWDKLDQAIGGAQKALGNPSTFFERCILIWNRNETPSTNTKGHCKMATHPHECHPQVQCLLWTTGSFAQSSMVNTSPYTSPYQARRPLKSSIVDGRHLDLAGNQKNTMLGRRSRCSRWDLRHAQMRSVLRRTAVIRHWSRQPLPVVQ